MTPDVDTATLRIVADRFLDQPALSSGFNRAVVHAAADCIDALRARVAGLEPKWVEGPPPDDRKWYWIVDDTQRLYNMTGQNAQMLECTFHRPIMWPAPPAIDEGGGR